MDVPPGRQGLIFTQMQALRESLVYIRLQRVRFLKKSYWGNSFGIIADIIGRKWDFNLTCLIISVFGMLLVLDPRPLSVRMKTNLRNFSPQAAVKTNYPAICGVLLSVMHRSWGQHCH